MFALRVDASLRILWAAQGSVNAGIRIGESIGALGLVSLADLMEFARAVGTVIATDKPFAYRSSLGAVLLVPACEGAVTAFLTPDGLEVDRQARDLDTEPDDFISEAEAVA